MLREVAVVVSSALGSRRSVIQPRTATVFLRDPG